jgi:hypothetical protein
VPCDLRRWLSCFFGFARIGTFGFSSPYPRNTSTYSLRSAALTYLPLTRGFLWLLDARALVDLWASAMWLTDMLVLLLKLLLAFPVRSFPLRVIMAR